MYVFEVALQLDIFNSNCSFHDGQVCLLAVENKPIFVGDLIDDQNSDTYIENGHFELKSTVTFNFNYCLHQHEILTFMQIETASYRI